MSFVVIQRRSFEMDKKNIERKDRFTLFERFHGLRQTDARTFFFRSCNIDRAQAHVSTSIFPRRWHKRGHLLRTERQDRVSHPRSNGIGSCRLLNHIFQSKLARSLRRRYNGLPSESLKDVFRLLGKRWDHRFIQYPGIRSLGTFGLASVFFSKRRVEVLKRGSWREGGTSGTWRKIQRRGSARSAPFFGRRELVRKDAKEKRTRERIFLKDIFQDFWWI